MAISCKDACRWKIVWKSKTPKHLFFLQKKKRKNKVQIKKHTGKLIPFPVKHVVLHLRWISNRYVHAMIFTEMEG